MLEAAEVLNRIHQTRLISMDRSAVGDCTRYDRDLATGTWQMISSVLHGSRSVRRNNMIIIKGTLLERCSQRQSTRRVNGAGWIVIGCSLAGILIGLYNLSMPPCEPIRRRND